MIEILIGQAEVAKDLINNTDATVQGILLGVVAVLITFIGILWKSNEKKDEYIRSQDKANLQMLSDLAKNSESLGGTINKVEGHTSEMRPEIKMILDRILQIQKHNE